MDNWISRLRSLHRYLRQSTVVPMEAKITDMTDPNGGSNWSEILEYIAACPPPVEVLGDDTCIWKNNDSEKTVNKSRKSLKKIDKR
ncbi:hypothetical protein EPI10_019716 [Gossypium australe]|uniref:Uncharacterized protein n=1 Tax=Gossypium australe TaxID=47621 RepID=A0A5B6WBP1_9ROSI|nr:hypothetical protein EPI10_019716 [Gossypium australe]